MELFGIVLSIPVAFVASTAYCWIAATFIARSRNLSRTLFVFSTAILCLFAVELVAVLTVGAVTARDTLGPAFMILHYAIFLFAVPALANVLILSRALRWWVAVPICTVLALVLVLLQYSVTDALYGIDGEGGPFS